MSKLRWTVIAATAGLAASIGSPAQAGLFDFLFGGGNVPQAPSYGYGPPPLDVRVNPRKRSYSPRKAWSGRDAKARKQTPIDPVKNANWYLDDPTLRRGDIVVLKGRVLVYDGGRGTRSKDDFTPLSRSRLVSKGDRDKIEKMVQKGPETASVEVTPPTVTGALADKSDKTSTAKEASLR